MSRSLSDLESKLILHLEWEQQPVVTIAQAARLLEISPDYARQLLQRLARDRWLVPIVPGVYERIPAERLAAEQPESFDVVTCMEMLEHVPDPASVINACARLAKPGGHLFFSTLNRNPKSYLFAIVGAEYILRLLPKGTHDFAKFIKPSELDRWIRQANLTTREMTGLVYNPLTQQYRLDARDVDVNYMVACRKDE